MARHDETRASRRPSSPSTSRNSDRRHHTTSNSTRRNRSISPGGHDRSPRSSNARKSHHYRSRSISDSEERPRHRSKERHSRSRVDRLKGKERDSDRAPRHRATDRSPNPSSHHSRRRRSRSRSSSPRPSRRSKQPLPSQQDAFEKTPTDATGMSTPAAVDKERANFKNTGRLAAEANTVRSSDGTSSIVLKYHEPPEARKPPAKDAWRLYIFKDDEILETVQLGDRSCWLVGKETFVADLPIEHPSCSKQHAAIQFRFIEKRNEFGDRVGKVKPYLIDLESANGTTLNGEPAPTGRYLELRDKDVLKFGLSTREYVLLLPPPG
ncbi:hypothetical protein FQN57_000373 [Myotisia sp. PD_48]|nr:hypothetical protein FQN57_000373 [Myotisia sp. PD_48]